MPRISMALTLLIGSLLGLTANGQNVSESTATSIPSYQVSFERREAAFGSDGWMALRLPFECTSDGTIFVDFITTPPSNPEIEPPVFPATTMISLSLDGHLQTFRLDHAPNLYYANMSFYAAESGVTFLVSGTLEKKLVSGTSTDQGGDQHEFIRNDAERHVYILSFDRDGTYQRSIEIKPAFPVQRLGVFQSGTLLAYGYDWESHSRRLALLNKDGSLLKKLELPPDDKSTSAEGRSLRPAQLMPYDHSIFVLQNQTLPLLEVNERGEIRTVRPKLPEGQHIETLIPSDTGLYVVLAPNSREAKAMAVYEISPEDGALLKHFELGDRTALNVACVHDRKFLSIDYANGKIFPLVGWAKSEVTADQPGTVVLPKH